jgi:hypothetical protein
VARYVTERSVITGGGTVMRDGFVDVTRCTYFGGWAMITPF